MKYTIKLYLFYFLIFFCIDLSFAWGHENIILRWPSLNIISSLLKINNVFGNDLYTNSLLNTPLRITINIFSKVLPETHLELISAYSIFSLLIKSLLPITLIFLSTVITTLIVKEINNGKNFNIKHHFTFLFFIGNLIFYISNQSELLKDIFFGTPIAEWGFPTALATSRGISLFISLLSVNIAFLLKLFRPRYNELSKSLLIILFIINLTASIIHPISPLFSLLIVFILNIILNETLIISSKLFLVYFASWISGVILISFLYPQGIIDNLDLFRIYIENNHASHYLPSYYIKEILKWKLLIFNCFISIFFIIFQNKNHFTKKIFTNLLISNIAILTIFNFSQYFLVEMQKNPLFIKLGLTFLNISYNFIYFISILLFIVLNIFRDKRLLSNIFEIGLIKSYKGLKLIDLFLLSLTIFTLILTTNIYESNLVKIKESTTYITGNKIQSLNIDNSEFIIDTKLVKDLKHPRELGLIKVFSDNYFHFNIESLKLSETKSKHLKELEDCLKKNTYKCYLPIQYEKEIFYISKSKQTLLGKEIFYENINNIPIYIYTIYKK